MLTVVDAAAIGRSCSAGNTADIESGAVVVVGEYSIIELRIHVAIMIIDLMMRLKDRLKFERKGEGLLQAPCLSLLTFVT